MKNLAIIFFLALLVPVCPLNVFSHSAHKSGHDKKSVNKIPDASNYIHSAGHLPGITWVDDIHPIFVRNECGHCHTQGNEATVENLQEFALGIIDKNNPDNPYFSYHELVYSEGNEILQTGERFRDGQCCWPKDYPLDQQRRIWIGYPERSALLRKLDHDYYDWNSPPNNLHGGLKLLWGVPMPMWHPNEKNEGKESAFSENYKIVPFWKRIGNTKKFTLPPLIPSFDRMLIRYWIQNAIQLQSESGFEVLLKDKNNSALTNFTFYLVGNYTSPFRQEIADIIPLQTNNRGVEKITFPQESIVSYEWFIFKEKPGPKVKHHKILIEPGSVVNKTIIF